MLRLMLWLLLLVGSLPVRAQVRLPILPDSLRPKGPLAGIQSPMVRTVVAVAPPVALLTYGILIRNNPPKLLASRHELREEVREHFADFETTADDYTRHVPTAAVFGLSLAGVPARHGLLDRAALFTASSLVSTGITSFLKRRVKDPRPYDPTELSSFPSYHTTQAFTGATVLAEEYGGHSGWIMAGGYGVATATGAMRVLNDRHWVTDVAVGAAIGILSTEAVYAVYPLVKRAIFGPGKKKASRAMVVPVAPVGTRLGAALTWMLR